MSTVEQRREWNRAYISRHREIIARKTKAYSEQLKERYRSDPDFRKERLEYAKKYAKGHRAQINERKRSPEYRAVAREQSRRYHFAHSIHARFGITAQEYEAMLESQKGVCALCGQEEKEHDHRFKFKRRLAVDHNHSTGKIRGLLCARCNKGIGHFLDNPDLLQCAIEYLKINS